MKTLTLLGAMIAGTALVTAPVPAEAHDTPPRRSSRDVGRHSGHNHFHGGRQGNTRRRGRAVNRRGFGRRGMHHNHWHHNHGHRFHGHRIQRRPVRRNWFLHEQPRFLFGLKF